MDELEQPIGSSDGTTGQLTHMACAKCQKLLTITDSFVDSDGIVRYVLERCYCGVNDQRGFWRTL